MKWCVIGYEYQKYRYDFLSQWMSENGQPNTLEHFEITPTDYSDHIGQLKKDFDQIRIERPFRNEAYRESTHNEAKMLLLRSADTAFKDATGEWWLRSALYEGINSILNSLKVNLNLEGAALVVGAGGAARAAIAALVKAGYQTFNVSNSFDDQARELIVELRKMYFSVKFNFVSQGELVLLPGTNSIVVNATPISATNDLLDELQYFNFLLPHGLVWDFTLHPVETALTKEAEEIGAKIFRGYQFAAQTDVQWLQWVCPQLKMSPEDYSKQLLAMLEKLSETAP